MSDLEQTQRSALNAIQAATSADELEAIRIQLLGKKGEITQHLKAIQDRQTG